VLNVTRLIKQYSEKGKAQFIEDVIFKTIIPVSNGKNEGAFEGASKKLQARLLTLIKAITVNEGKRIHAYTNDTGFTTKSMERYLKMLREDDFIEFKGDSTQTGGYYLTKKSKELLK